MPDAPVVHQDEVATTLASIERLEKELERWTPSVELAAARKARSEAGVFEAKAETKVGPPELPKALSWAVAGGHGARPARGARPAAWSRI